MSSHPHGEGIQILRFGQNRKIIVNQKILEEILLHEEVKNRPVVILSIVGAFRKGKSFFLNYCLRFLYANVSYFFGHFVFKILKIILFLSIHQLIIQTTQQKIAKIGSVMKMTRLLDFHGNQEWHVTHPELSCGMMFFSIQI